jgi:serine/threonine protein kinase
MILSSFSCPYLMSAKSLSVSTEELTIITNLALSDLLHEVKRLKPSTEMILDWVSSILLALSTLHAASVVHGDVKARNVLLFGPSVPSGSVGKNTTCGVRLNDFNLSRFSFISMKGRFAYTNSHRAPEIWLRQEWGMAADIWALGCTIFELATGHQLFSAKNGAKDNWDEITKTMLSKIAKWTYDFHGKSDFGFPLIPYAEIPSSLRNHPTLWPLMKSCLHPNPLSRPSCNELLGTYFSSLKPAISQGPLPTPVFEISDYLLPHIRKLATPYEVHYGVRHLLQKLPPSFHTEESCRILLHIVKKLFFFQELPTLSGHEIATENEYCRRLVFNLYFRL